jgi:hypothetical protein
MKFSATRYLSRGIIASLLFIVMSAVSWGPIDDVVQEEIGGEGGESDLLEFLIEGDGMEDEEIGEVDLIESPAEEEASAFERLLPMDEEDDFLPIDEENVEASSNSTDYSVGVIPSNGSCPGGTVTLKIRMDDEDDDNENRNGGWKGAISQDHSGTLFQFCKVNGTQFKPLATTDNSRNYYAVLKLGGSCPLNSYGFSRYFDNEDDDNANWSEGNIHPNTCDSNTRLYFCLFKFGSSTMTSFPNLGMSYGVFAASFFSKAIQVGYVYTDDEDDDNENSYSAPPSIAPAAKSIISDGSNTTLKLAKVK